MKKEIKKLVNKLIQNIISNTTSVLSTETEIMVFSLLDQKLHDVYQIKNSKTNLSLEHRMTMLLFIVEAWEDL